MNVSTASVKAAGIAALEINGFGQNQSNKNFERAAQSEIAKPAKPDEAATSYVSHWLEGGAPHPGLIVETPGMANVAPLYSPKKIAQIIKSLTAREVFKSCPEVKQYLWGGKFWSEGYFVSTVGAHGNEQMIKNYVQQQGKVEFKTQLDLF